MMSNIIKKENILANEDVIITNIYKKFSNKVSNLDSILLKCIQNQIKSKSITQHKKYEWSSMKFCNSKHKFINVKKIINLVSKSFGNEKAVWSGVVAIPKVNSENISLFPVKIIQLIGNYRISSMLPEHLIILKKISLNQVYKFFTELSSLLNKRLFALGLIQIQKPRGTYLDEFLNLSQGYISSNLIGFTNRNINKKNLIFFVLTSQSALAKLLLECNKKMNRNISINLPQQLDPSDLPLVVIYNGNHDIPNS
jgi:hypothetical protein